MKKYTIDEKYNMISRIEFCITAYYLGYEDKTFTVKDGKVIANTDRVYNVDALNTISFNEELQKDEFISALKELKVINWQRNYNPKSFDFSIRDTILWHLKIHFSSDLRSVSINGCNHFPREFNSLLNLLGIQIIKNVEII